MGFPRFTGRENGEWEMRGRQPWEWMSQLEPDVIGHPTDPGAKKVKVVYDWGELMRGLGFL
jgi:hypothetical protein